MIKNNVEIISKKHRINTKKNIKIDIEIILSPICICLYIFKLNPQKILKLLNTKDIYYSILNAANEKTKKFLL